MKLRLYLFLLVQIMLLLRIVTLGSAQYFFKETQLKKVSYYTFFCFSLN